MFKSATTRISSITVPLTKKKKLLHVHFQIAENVLISNVSAVLCLSIICNGQLFTVDPMNEEPQLSKYIITTDVHSATCKFFTPTMYMYFLFLLSCIPMYSAMI